MPNILDGDVPKGPEDEAEGPWFYLSAHLRKMAEFVADHPHELSSRVQGADYWRVTSWIRPAGHWATHASSCRPKRV